MALRQQIVKYVTMGISKATTGDYHPDNRHSTNHFEDSLIWLKHTIRNFFVKQNPILENLQVKQFMLENELPFKEYAPDIFAELRQLEDITDQDYLIALSTTEKEQLSEGASGAFMFFCGNMKYIVKTINPREAAVLHSSLDLYLNYLKSNPNSLLVKFLGSYSLKIYTQTFHFIIMKNLFEPKIDINERFDIKGSYVGRYANLSPPNKSIICRHCNEIFVPSAKEKCTKIIGYHEGNVVLKDNDLRVKISLKKSDAMSLLDILKKDSDLLAQLGVLDYRYSLHSHFHNHSFHSLIIGIKKQTFDINNDDDDDHEGIDVAPVSPSFLALTHSKQNSKSKKKYLSWKANSISGPAIYYMGIIDFLQEWNLRKTMERAFKIYFQRHDPDGISVMQPGPYRDRFQNKMAEIFNLEDYHSDDLMSQRRNMRGSASLRGDATLRLRHQHNTPSPPHFHAAGGYRFRSRSRSNSFTPESISGTVMSMLRMNSHPVSTTEHDDLDSHSGVELSVLHHPVTIDEGESGELQQEEWPGEKDEESLKILPPEEEDEEEGEHEVAYFYSSSSPKVKGKYHHLAEDHL